MKNFHYLFVMVLLVSLSSCQTIKTKKHQLEYLNESQEAIGTIAEAVTGRPMTEEEKKALGDQLRRDPDAQSAVESIANSISEPVRMKYSPSTGKRYAPHLEYDPETGAQLLWLDDD